MENKEKGCTGLNLMSPIRLGPFHLSHRVVLAPMTRCRAINTIPNEAHVQYYTQRATRGGLLITEAVAVSDTGHGFPNAPGIYNEEQMEGWRKVVESVHSKGAVIVCQIWHVGRASHRVYQPRGEAPVSSTNKRVSDRWKIIMPDGSTQPYTDPRAMSTTEIKEMVRAFGDAAKRAMRVGFDGVEIHAGHGYLVDQFMKDSINDRRDEYGAATMETRCRFAKEVVSAVVEAAGADRTAMRISPVVDHLDAFESDPMALGRYVVEMLNPLGLCYLHLTQPRYSARRVNTAREMEAFNTCHSELRKAYRGTLMSTGGYTRASGMDAVRHGDADLVSYGRLFVSNPDLPLRFRLGAPLNKYDRSTFYTSHPVKGYTDYPFLDGNDELHKPVASGGCPPPIIKKLNSSL